MGGLCHGDQSWQKEIDMRSVKELDVAGKTVLVRADLEAQDREDPRFVVAKQMVGYLRQGGAQNIKLIGHKGAIWMVEELGVAVNYDLRSDPREEQNGVELAVELAEGFDVYVNEAFPTSHRSHASITALPRHMAAQGKQVCVGIRFAEEVKMLSRVLNNEGRKILVIGGVKENKAAIAKLLSGKFDVVLSGGRLPGAELRPDGLDISDDLIEQYKRQMGNAGVIVVAGPMGKFEEMGAQKGTREVFTMVANTKAYKIAGGGETEDAIRKLGLEDKFDWISVGGGAMLEFLAEGTLVGIEALVQ